MKVKVVSGSYIVNAGSESSAVQFPDKRQLLDGPLLAAHVTETAGRVVAVAVTQYPETADWEWSVALIDDPETRLATEVAAMVAVTLPNSRAGESESDLMGIELAARAGYDPTAGASLWLKMEEEGGSIPLQFLSTHPSPDNRREALPELGAQVRPLMPVVPPEPYPIEVLTAN